MGSVIADSTPRRDLLTVVNIGISRSKLVAFSTLFQFHERLIRTVRRALSNFSHDRISEYFATS